MNELRTMLYVVVSLGLIAAGGYIWDSGLGDWARWFGVGYLALVWVVAVRLIRRLA